MAHLESYRDRIGKNSAYLSEHGTDVYVHVHTFITSQTCTMNLVYINILINELVFTCTLIYINVCTMYKHVHELINLYVNGTRP